MGSAWGRQEVRRVVRRDQRGFLLVIVVIPYPSRLRCNHIGTPFEGAASVALTAALALTACTWMARWFNGLPGRRVMDSRRADDFLRQMIRRYGAAPLVQMGAVAVAVVAPAVGVAIGLL